MVSEVRKYRSLRIDVPVLCPGGTSMTPPFSSFSWVKSFDCRAKLIPPAPQLLHAFGSPAMGDHGGEESDDGKEKDEGEEGEDAGR
eukprot:768452-Hanusia_phi.AAC.12